MKELEIFQSRLLSLDFFRGLTMFLLIVEFTHLFEHLISPELQGTFIYNLGIQFHHHPWNGLRFWDLIQPFFMFIVGVAMPFSYNKRIKQGQSHNKILKHILIRSFLLLFLGWWVILYRCWENRFSYAKCIGSTCRYHSDFFFDNA